MARTLTATFLLLLARGALACRAPARRTHCLLASMAASTTRRSCVVAEKQRAPIRRAAQVCRESTLPVKWNSPAS